MRLSVNHALPLAALVLLAACGMIGGGDARTAPAPVASGGPAADYPVVLGEPFTIEGTTYTPSDRLNHDEVGYGSIGADGGGGVSIAHKTLPLPSYVEVTTLDSGRTILARVVRRGPMTNERIAELSPGAAAQLGVSAQEKPALRIRRVNPPEVERAALRSGQRAQARIDTPQGLLTVLRRKLEPQRLTLPPPEATPAPVPVPSASVTPAPRATPSPRVTPAARPSPMPRATPSPKPSPTPRATPTPRPSPAPRATPTPRPTPSPHATPKPRATPAPAPSPTPRASASPAITGSFVVQVGTFSVQQNARTAAAKTGGQARQGGELWRVRMGPFANRAAAEAALAKARAAGYRDARIQRAD